MFKLHFFGNLNYPRCSSTDNLGSLFCPYKNEFKNRYLVHALNFSNFYICTNYVGTKCDGKLVLNKFVFFAFISILIKSSIVHKLYVAS